MIKRNCKNLAGTLLLLCGFHFSFAQNITQTIRGRVMDNESRSSLPGANIVLLSDTSTFTGATADVDGYFRMEKVPLGRHTLQFTYLGYEPMIISNIIVNSGKEVILTVKMEESVVKMKEVEITASRGRGEAMNEMATISARAFSVEETERYAGSRGDPARMASNFAGCQGADDSRNDIVIRGNSPLGILWRVEGVDIPNPNHFAISGSAGGPVSILNNKVLSNSDFFTGAFPAEFGNSIAGVFDIHMRNGNNEQHEFTGQFGFLGTELTAEGPISKTKRSSYLLNYRYSTLSLFSFMGINIGTTATPRYQDAAFKLNFPNKKGAVSLFGIGGMSDIDIMISKQKPDEVEIYGDQDRDQYFSTGMGVVGLNYTRSFNAKTFGKLTIAQSVEEQRTHHEFVQRATDSLGNFIMEPDGLYKVDTLIDILDFSFKTFKTSAAFFVNYKINAKHVIKAGLNADMFRFDMIDSVRTIDSLNSFWTTRWDYQGQAFLLQPYLQWKWKLSDKLLFNSGVHSQYFSLNGSLSVIEPRAGLKWLFAKKQSFSAGFGMHSQLQPMYTYFYQVPDSIAECGCQLHNKGKIMHNLDMGFTKSIHYVLGYDNRLATNLRLKVEAYYQQLYDIPVTVVPSSFSLVNQGSGFSRFFPDSLQNTGTGENYGLELTIEKFFSKKFFFMLTASYFESKYKGSDGIRRDTDFNGNYAANLLTAKEFKTGKKSSMTLGAKITAAGNKRYGPVDTLKTEQQGEIIYLDSERNTLQFAPYFRVDLKINYKINAKKVTHEFGLDLVNVTGQQNVLKLTYAPDPNDPSANAIREEYQLGFLPIFYYKIDF